MTAMLGRLAFALVMCWMALGAASARGEPMAGKFDPARDAAADVARAVTEARSSHRRVIVDVGGEWCGWCHILDRFVAANADVKALIERSYVWVKVNYSKENRNEALLSRWPKVAGYPHLFVLDANGNLVHSQNTDALESGTSYDRTKTLEFLRRWAPDPRAQPSTAVLRAPDSSRADWRASAHATCSRTSGDASSTRVRSASTIAGSGAALPSPTAMLRSQRS